MTTLQKTTISQNEAARRLGTSPATIAKAIRAGQLKAVRIGAHKRIIADSVEALLAEADRRPQAAIATVQGAIREHFGMSATREKAEKICATLGFTPVKGAVNRAVLDLLKGMAENTTGRARIAGIVNATAIEQ